MRCLAEVLPVVLDRGARHTASVATEKVREVILAKRRLPVSYLQCQCQCHSVGVLVCWSGGVVVWWCGGVLVSVPSAVVQVQVQARCHW